MVERKRQKAENPISGNSPEFPWLQAGSESHSAHPPPSHFSRENDVHRTCLGRFWQGIDGRDGCRAAVNVPESRVCD
jgi:hypothetical protein